ncbi:hypothetical protein [Massilia sp. CCM 8734]|uniref:hypothetical protein n=1 Tax=Massilia sp. CCM 8734 TaxID=2609283 RepID=UPI0014218FA8|nr:hypothetical protein [Massilia sp. CCM 8734]NHZ99428.1 hypothetical protein [Massilia sp. CCM 8734]
MRPITTLLFASLALPLISAAIPAHACKLAAEAYDLTAFLAKKDTRQVVFLGKASSVESLPTAPGLLVHQKITFETTRWWRGAPSKMVSASGIVEKPMGSTCDGEFDFSVTAGAEWLIVGYVEDGKVHPMPKLSERLTNGEIPRKVLHLLGAGQ